MLQYLNRIKSPFSAFPVQPAFFRSTNNNPESYAMLGMVYVVDTESRTISGDKNKCIRAKIEIYLCVSKVCLNVNINTKTSTKSILQLLNIAHLNKRPSAERSSMPLRKGKSSESYFNQKSLGWSYTDFVGYLLEVVIVLQQRNDLDLRFAKLAIL